jgi:hypothetical protein
MDVRNHISGIVYTSNVHSRKKDYDTNLFLAFAAFDGKKKLLEPRIKGNGG